MTSHDETKISIVIPTTGKRKELLRRAIASAFVDDESLFTEIIVVANGPDSKSFRLPDGISPPKNSYIQTVRTSIANVSHARNLGIEAATGQWLRFLDDDDFLLPDTAKQQYLEAISSSCDISTYAGAIQDEHGHTFQTICPDRSQGYAHAVLGPNCPALTFSSVYRMDKVRHLRWNEAWTATEDEDWMRRILQSFTPEWVVNNDVTGIWYQHAQSRLSKPIPANKYYTNRAASIIESIETLNNQNRLEEIQKKAAANGLWSAIHGGFFFSPIYWSRISIRARKLDEFSKPKDRIFSILPWVHPLIIEWIFLPKRLINHTVRMVKGKFFGFGIVRKIP